MYEAGQKIYGNNDYNIPIVSLYGNTTKLNQYIYLSKYFYRICDISIL